VETFDIYLYDHVIINTISGYLHRWLKARPVPSAERLPCCVIVLSGLGHNKDIWLCAEITFSNFECMPIQVDICAWLRPLLNLDLWTRMVTYVASI